MIEDKICVRAPFHEPSTAREEIIVSPKMAFGTAHHATTYMMLNAMHSLELANSSVLDIGCGTGILGIYAANRNSIEVGAYDFDEWSVANTIENAGLNSVDKLEVWLGDVDSIPKRTYDYILANINLNTLRDQLESYLKHLNPNGLILMSGVLATDRKALQELAQALNLKLVSEQTRENWLQQTYGWN
jgi:ribosomal protein L11 methyltransferase